MITKKLIKETKSTKKQVDVIHEFIACAEAQAPFEKAWKVVRKVSKLKHLSEYDSWRYIASNVHPIKNKEWSRYTTGTILWHMDQMKRGRK